MSITKESASGGGGGGGTITEWVSYTPTGSWASTTYLGKWRRVGDTMEITALASLTGAPSGNLTIDIPATYTIDTGKFELISGDRPLGIGTIKDASTGVEYAGQVHYSDTNSVKALYLAEQDETNDLTEVVQINATSPMTFASGDKVYVKFAVPITGWGA